MLDVMISPSSSMFSAWLKNWQDKDKVEDMSNWRKRWSVSDSFSSSRKGKPYALMWGAIYELNHVWLEDKRFKYDATITSSDYPDIPQIESLSQTEQEKNKQKHGAIELK